jgi:MarR family transcriptional regulator, organic hydroperoxide resistance regulator
MLVHVAIETTKSPDTQDSPLGSLASEAWALFQKLAYAHKPAMIATAREFDLLPPHMMALRLLDQPTPMGELARQLFCDNSNITGIVDRLEERDLVERKPDEHDRRVKLLVLTSEGRRVREQVMARLSVPPAAIESLSLDDLSALHDILERASEQLD